MPHIDDFYKVIEELTPYAEADGCEWGETAIALINLWNLRTYLDEKFLKQLEKEIKSWLKNVQENTEWVETEHTHTHKVRELVWL